MPKPRTITIDGKQYLWPDIVELRRAQLAASRKAEQQAALFELIEDHRPVSQLTPAGRLSQPILFD
jgi:hypothetical protein